MQQAYKIVFATKSNKDNLDQDADIIIITPDDHSTYYNNLPVCAKYIFACNTQKKYVKIPFGCAFAPISKEWLKSGSQILRFELPEKVKIILDDEPVKDLIPSYKKVNDKHIYSINGVKWSKLSTHYKVRMVYSSIIVDFDFDDDDE